MPRSGLSDNEMLVWLAKIGMGHEPSLPLCLKVRLLLITIKWRARQWAWKARATLLGYYDRARQPFLCGRDKHEWHYGELTNLDGTPYKFRCCLICGKSEEL